MSVTKSEPMPIMEWEAPDFSLVGTSDEEFSLENIEGYNGLLVVFTCNHCPYARAAWPTLVDLHELYGKEIAFVAINSNDSDTYPEDSFEEMKKRKEEWGILFPYLWDESQEVAEEYQAQCTPDPYLFKYEDGVWKLFYHGRINDNWQHPEQVKQNNLEDAMVSLLGDEEPPENQPASMGCSIKWK